MLSERIRKVRIDLFKGAQDDFAKSLNWTPSRIKDLERGKVKELKAKEAQDIEEKFRVNGWWLLTGKGSMELSPKNTSDKISIPLYKDYRLSAGDGAINYSCDTDILTFDTHYYMQFIYHRQNGIFCGIIDGDSMLPTFNNGDIVFIDTTELGLRDGYVYAINYFGENMIKRVRKYKTDFVFVGDNEDIEKVKFRKAEDGVHIVGRAVRGISIKDI